MLSQYSIERKRQNSKFTAIDEFHSLDASMHERADYLNNETDETHLNRMSDVRGNSHDGYQSVNQ